LRFLKVAICLAFIFLLIDFASFSQRFVPERSFQVKHSPVDLIVALTGGRGRLAEGLKALAEKRGKFMMITGVHKDSNLKSILAKNEALALLPEFKDKIILDRAALNTYQNAHKVAEYVAANGVESVLLITSSYHIKRASYLFKNAFEERGVQGLRVIHQSIESDNFPQGKWKSKPLSWWIAFTEYLKWIPLRFAL